MTATDPIVIPVSGNLDNFAVQTDDDLIAVSFETVDNDFFPNHEITLLFTGSAFTSAGPSVTQFLSSSPWPSQKDIPNANDGFLTNVQLVSTYTEVVDESVPNFSVSGEWHLNFNAKGNFNFFVDGSDSDEGGNYEGFGDIVLESNNTWTRAEYIRRRLMGFI